MIDAAEIIAEAEARVGITDFDAPQLMRNFNALADSISRNARMPAWGEEITAKGLVDRTADRLEGLRWLGDYPEIADEVIEAPVFLTGLPRSGTTAFQYLFDRDPRFRMIRTWEGLTPNPPPGLDPGSTAISTRSRCINFTRIHKTLRVTPAMAAGLAEGLSSMEDVAALIDATAEEAWALQKETSA